jgi:protein required for attachment to host cells
VRRIELPVGSFAEVVLKLPHASLVALANGQRHLVLENRGKPVAWDLQVVWTDEIALQSTRSLGAERPGRYPVAGGRRTAVEQTDWKALDKAAFAKALAEYLNDLIAQSPDRALVLVADAKTMGHLRDSLSALAKKSLLREIVGDHVQQPIDAIESVLKTV